MEILIIAAFTPNSPDVAKGPFCESCYVRLLKIYSIPNVPKMSKAQIVSVDVIDELSCISCGDKIVKLVDGELELTSNRPLLETMSSIHFNVEIEKDN